MFKKINFYQILITIVAVILTSAAIAYGWTAPVAGPPGNDTEPPINTGLTGQIKQGGLTLGSVAGVQLGLGVLNGNVGIGTITPNPSKGIGGYLDARDVYLRDVSKWASELGGGGGGAPIINPLSGNFSGAYTFTAPAGTTPISLTVNIDTSGASNSAGIMEARWLNSASGVVKDWTRISGTNITWGRDGGS
ncbi:MAG: hypothetical protein NUV83_03440, partial [Candidatus Wolfebacteria bacterium]|nr:hypothetical protein [Candidatus Wolfebacteria bacterium]